MITECEYPECDNETDMPFNCSRCERNFCADHRLPENHACSLNTYNPDHQRAYFREKVDSVRGGLSSSVGDTEEEDLTNINPTPQPDDVIEAEPKIVKPRRKKISAEGSTRNKKSYSNIIINQLIILYHLIVIVSIISVTYGFISS